MSSSESRRLVRSFRLASLVVYLLNMVICINFLISPEYLHVLVGFLCSFATLVMLFVALNCPKFIMRILDTPRFSFLFTFRGRYIVDLLVSLFLYAMGIWGILMATATLCLIFGIRFMGVKHPEAFSDLFRNSADLDDDNTVFTDGDTYDDGGTYDGGTYEGSTIESGHR